MVCALMLACVRAHVVPLGPALFRAQQNRPHFVLNCVRNKQQSTLIMHQIKGNSEHKIRYGHHLQSACMNGAHVRAHVASLSAAQLPAQALELEILDC